MNASIIRIVNGKRIEEPIDTTGLLEIRIDPGDGGVVSVSRSNTYRGGIRISTRGAIGISPSAANVILVWDETKKGGDA